MAIDNNFKIKNGLVVSSTATIQSTTQAISTTTGALQVAGGAAIAKNLHVGGNLVVTGTISSTSLAALAVAVTNDTTTDNNAYYPAMAFNQATGNINSVYVSSTKFFFNPSSGSLTTPVLNTTKIVVDGLSTTDTASLTTTSVTATTLASFPLANYGGGKFLIQASQGTVRQITELLVLQDGTTASAAEYGTILTGSRLFNVDVSIVSTDVLVIVTSTSATSTVYKTTYTLIGA